MARSMPSPRLNFSEFEYSLRWLERQPREVSVTIAARVALRVLPQIVRRHDRLNFTGAVALPIFRANAVAWTGAKYPAFASGLQEAIHAAGYYPMDLEILVEQTAATSVDASYAAYAAADALRAAGGPAYSADAARSAAGNAIPASADAAFIREGGSLEVRKERATKLAGMSLWLSETPSSIYEAWAELREVLLRADEGWEVWVDWYEDRLVGRSSDDGVDIAVANLPDYLWLQGPKAVNARIKELLAERTPTERIPTQGAGPHFTLSPDLKITLAQPSEIDADGNNLGRIRQLLPQVRQAAGDLAGHVTPNTQPEISRNLKDYRDAIAGEPETIAWGAVFGLGVRLENAASAARREIANRLQEPLEDAAQEALDSVLTLHGLLILASDEGRELSEQADAFRLTAHQRTALNRDALTIAGDFSNSPDLIEPLAAQTTGAAADATGDGPHPERGAVYWLSTVKNVATVLLPAAMIGSAVIAGVLIGGPVGGAIGGTISWPTFEVFKQTALFKAATAALAPDLNRLILAGGDATARVLRALPPFRAFVIRHQEALRRIAEVGKHRWMLRYIDFIVRANGDRH